MKKILVLGFVISFDFILSAQQDPYDKLASDMANLGKDVKKIAVIPFSYAQNTASTKDGSVISERLTMKLINLQKFEIIERSVLNKVLDELKLQSSGVIDASSAKELGKVLGVDAIITGTLIPTADGRIEVNARIIRTETAQAIGASQVYVIKDWLGGDVQQVQTLQPQQYTEQPGQSPQTTQTTRIKNPDSYGFFDVIAGFGSQKLEATADPNAVLMLSDIRWGKLTEIDVKGAGPIGLRVGGFGKSIVGGDFEFSFTKHYTPAQNILFTSGQIRIMPENYFDVTSFGLSGDLLLRTMGKKANFYLGFGLGMSLNTIKSNYIYDYDGKPLDELDIGWILRMPIGVRFILDNTTFFVEWRFEGQYTSFDRGRYGSESNSLDFTGQRLIFGLGSKF
jgi:hypothetical protein